MIWENSMNEIFKENKNFVKICMPSLLYLLNANERNKGSDLTKKEVEEVCAKANVALVEFARLKEIESIRGYKDLSGDNFWEEWQLFKQKMNDSMNKNYKEKIENNLLKSISAHIDFKRYKPNFFKQIFKKVLFQNVESEIVTKFGGYPCMLAQSEWPRSKSTGKLMKFIGQIVIDNNLFPKAGKKIIYLFITEHTDVDNTYDPDGGENAVIIKQIDYSKISRKTLYQAKGPIFDKEYRPIFTYKEEPSFAEGDWDESQYEEYYNNVDGSKIAGSASFIQRDIPEFDDSLRLLLQLDSSETPFEIDFGGGGVGYVFINEDCTKGKFLWQCD